MRWVEKRQQLSLQEEDRQSQWDSHLRLLSLSVSHQVVALLEVSCREVVSLQEVSCQVADNQRVTCSQEAVDNQQVAHSQEAADNQQVVHSKEEVDNQ